MARTLYKIGDRDFYQEELVFGQIGPLYERLAHYRLTDFSTDHPETVMKLVAKDLVGILAIVLIPAEMTQGEKVSKGTVAIDALELFLKANLKPNDAVLPIRDFFASGQVPRLAESLTAMFTIGTEWTGLLTPSSVSATAISPNETISSRT